MRFGWTIPAYTASAVIRNKLKRWVRHYLKQQTEQAASSFDVNLIFKNTAKSSKRSNNKNSNKGNREKNKEDNKEENFFKKLKHEEVNAALDTVFFKLSKKI